MKILLSAYACDPTRGSENKISWSWYQHYLQQGHEVWLLTMDWGKAGLEQALTEMNLPNAHVCYVDMPRWVERKHKNRKGSVWLYLHYIFFQRAVARKAKELDQQHDLDVLHHVSWGSIQMGTGLCRVKKPLIFGPMGGGQFPPAGFEEFFEDGWAKEVKRKKVSDFLLKYYPDSQKTLKRADLVLTVNQETYDMAKAHGAKRLEYFLDANFELDSFPIRETPHTNDGALRLIWVGRLLHRKALSFTLEALSKVPRSIPFHLDIYGDGDQGHRVDAWIEEHDLADRVTWHGQVPWTTVMEAYKYADAFLFNSLRESFGVQLLEAMIAGIPLICLDLHGAATFVPAQAAIKVPVTTPDETAQVMADAVVALYHDPKRREEMGKAGREFATQQRLSSKVAQVDAYLREVTDLDLVKS